MRRPVLLLIGFLFALPVLAQAPPLPDLSGFVTRIQPSGDFDVNDIPIQFSPHLKVEAGRTGGGAYTEPLTDRPHPYIGQHLDLFGKRNKKLGIFTVSRMIVYPSDRSPISGLAVVDLVPATQPPHARILRADGYFMMIPDSLVPAMHEPLAKTDSVHVNLWIAYHGTPGDDGVLVLDHADLYSNLVNRTEDKLRKKFDYDPAAVDPDAKQSGPSKFFLGVDPKKIPQWHDDAMQQRIERIGRSLIPAYQLALPDGDPTKIPFTFQLVDNSKLHDSLSMESGVILVPYQVVESLHSDAQIAAVLADSISEILEKQVSRFIPKRNGMVATNVAGAVAGAIVPGMGLVTSLTTGSITRHMLILAREQSGRVSLCLMHDAGYDILEAPEAWRLLATKNGKDADKTSLPDRSLKLYEYVGEIWRNPPPM